MTVGNESNKKGDPYALGLTGRPLMVIYTVCAMKTPAVKKNIVMEKDGLVERLHNVSRKHKNNGGLKS